MSAADDPAAYRRVVAAARQWEREVLRQAREGLWRASDAERDVLAALVVATRDASLTLPPHTRDPLWLRITRLSRWEGAIRLASHTTPTARLVTLPATIPDRWQANLGALLSAIYLIAAPPARWHDALHAAHGHSHEDVETVTTRWHREHPSLAEDVATAERHLTGPGAVGETLTALARDDLEH